MRVTVRQIEQGEGGSVVSYAHIKTALGPVVGKAGERRQNVLTSYPFTLNDKKHVVAMSGSKCSATWLERHIGVDATRREKREEEAGLL